MSERCEELFEIRHHRELCMSILVAGLMSKASDNTSFANVVRIAAEQFEAIKAHLDAEEAESKPMQETQGAES